MIVMTILVKDEIDIIEANIRTHAKLGVDAFVIMDNNSTDGTREKLEALKKEYEITIIDEKGLYNQAAWMKKLSKTAKKIYNPRWVINNDADEFWIPKNKQTIKEALPKKGAVLTCQRYNMIIDESASNGNFYDASYYVHNPIFYKKETQLTEDYPSIILTKIGPKVITDPKGLLLLRGGNHKALHLRNLRDYWRHYDKIKRFDEIEVFHFVLRSYEQFEKHIKIRKALLEDKKHIRMGPHYRRWVKLYNEGRLKEEWEERIVIKNHELEVFKKFGIAQKNEKFNSLIKENFV
jgi:glycosyltransferase involved in cell wall biosynthesis